MSMSLDEADIWELRQMAESPYYATRRQFLKNIADKLESMGERIARYDSLWAEYQERRHTTPNPAMLSIAAKRLESDLIRRVVDQRSTLFMDWYNKSPWSGAGKDAGTLAAAAWNAGVIAASEIFWHHEITKKRISIEDSQVLVGDIKWLSRNACDLDDEQPQHPE